MTKIDFILSLHNKLSDLPPTDIEEHLAFYIEMIEDRMEDGLSEEDAVAAVGSVDQIVSQIRHNIGVDASQMAQSGRSKKLGLGWLMLIILGSPLWLSLVIAAFAVVISLYAVLWSLIISLWAVFVSAIGSVVGAACAAVAFGFGGHAIGSFAMLAATMACAGLAIFLFFACRVATKGAAMLTMKSAMWIRNCFVKKEGVSWIV